MYDCWSRNLRGGLKSVERQLGIKRKLKDVDGRGAVELWYEYEAGNEGALSKLLKYNEEDLVNLEKLRNLLES